MIIRKWLLALVLIHAMGNPCNGSSAAAQGPMQWIVQWDNDLLAGTDRDYTNGGRVGFLQELAPNTVMDNRLRQWLHPLLGVPGRLLGSTAIPGREDDARFAWGIGITQLMFTPDDPNALQAPPGERPYAGWLGLEMSLHAKTERVVNSVTLVVGTTGQPSYARDIQNWIHENVSDSPLYQGWDSQIPAEPTLNLQFDHKLRLPAYDFDAPLPGLGVDGYGEWGVGLGNFRTDAYVGMLFRGGYNLPAHFTVPRVQLGSYGHRFFRDETESTSPWSLIGFTGVRAMAVARDITLDGPLFRSFDTGVQRKPWVGELLIGVGVRFREIEFTVSRSVRSKEFRNQSSHQQFGSVMLRLNAPF